MQQWNTVSDVTTTSLNSQGSAMREQEEYSKSLEARLNRLSNAGVELSQALGEAFLTDGIIVFAETITAMANEYEGVIETVGFLAPTIGATGLAVALFSKTARNMGTALLFGTTQMDKATASTLGLEVGMKRATVATNFFKTALRGLAVAGGITAAFALVGWGIEKLTNLIGENIRTQEEFRKANEQSVKSLQNDAKGVSELVDEYERLSQIGNNRDNEQESRYVQLQNELAQILPSVKVGEDEKGNSIIANTDAVRDYISSLELQLQLERENARASAPTTISDNSEAMDKNEESLAKYQERLKEASADMVRYASGEEEHQGRFTVAQENYSKASAKISELSAENIRMTEESSLAYQALANEVDNLSSSEMNWFGQMAMDRNIPVEEVKEFAVEVANIKEVLGERINLTNIGNEQQLGIIQSLTQSLEYGSVEWQKYGNLLLDAGMKSTEVNNLLGSLRYTQDELAQSARDAGVSMQTHVPMFDNMGQTINWVTQEVYDAENGFDSLEDSMSDVADEADEIFDAFDNATSKIKDLNSIIEDLNAGNGLTADSMSLIMEKYSQFLPYLDDEIALKEAIMQATKQEEAVAINAVRNKLLEETNFLDFKSQGNESFFKWLASAYSGDLSNFKNLAQAKSAVEQELLSKLAGGWQRYYNAQTGAFTQQYKAMSEMANDSSLGVMQREMLEQQVGAISRVAKDMRAINFQFDSAIGFNASSISLPTVSVPSPKSGGSKGKKSGKNDAAKQAKDAARAAEEAQRRVLEIINKQIDAYQRRSDALNDNIAHEEYYLAKYESTDRQYRQRQQNIAKLKKQQANFHMQTIRYIEGQLKSNKRLNTEQRQELQKTLISTRQTYYSTLSDIDSINKAIKDSYEEIAREIVDVYKKAYEQQKKVALDAINNEMKALEDSHKRKISMLDEELSSYEEIINAKLKSMDKDKESADYAEELAKKQKERLEIQRQIQLMSMDDSLSARNRVRDLEEELRDKEKEIADFTNERELQLRRESLQDQLEAKRDQINAERDMENEYHEDQKHQLDVDKQNIEQHYEDLINDERHFARLREQVLSDNTSNMSKTLQSFSKDIRNNMEVIGKSISQNLIDNLTEARKLLSGVGFNFNSRSTNTSGMPSSFSSGGYTGNFSGGKLAILHEQELILNKKDTKSFMEYNQKVNRLMPKTPSIGNIGSKDSGKSITLKPTFSYLIQGQFDEGLAKKYSNYTMKDLKSGLGDLGVQF